MKKLCAYLGIFSFLAVASVDAYKVDVQEKWPSPTPWLQDRCTDFLDCMPRKGQVVVVGEQAAPYAACVLRKTFPKQLFLVGYWEYQDPTGHTYLEPSIANEIYGQLYLEAQRRLKKSPRATILKLYSHVAATQFADESLDLVYIDANHGYEAVKNDLALWWPKIKKNGFLAGHGYIKVDSWGVVQAVNEFLNEHDLYFEYLTTKNGNESWAIQKPDA